MKNRSFFMPGFALLAGYFIPLLLEKKDPTSFLNDRLIRLGILLIVYTALIVNLNQFQLQVVWLKEPFTWLWEYNPGHLWFLQALLLFAVIFLILKIPFTQWVLE